MKGFFRFLLDCLFPRRCVSCDDYTGGRLVCGMCRSRLVPASAEGRLKGVVDRQVLSPYLTSGVLLDLVRFLKFEGGISAAGELGREMSATLRYHSGGFDDPVIVPVPLHWTRLARRGYDQASLLAAEVSRDTGIPLVRRAIGRRKRTKAQSSLEPGARRKNIAGAFRLRSAGPLRGKDIILVDDLVTTGETASACCRILEMAGPSSITILCAGRKRAGKN